MSEPLKKVQSGQRLRIPAAAYNAFVDAARDLRSREQSRSQELSVRQPEAAITVRVKNASGADVPRFGVLGIDHCFFALPEDHARTDCTYTEAGELDRTVRRAAFEVIFVYRPEDGMLEILAPGGSERVEDLAACFSAAILKLPALPPRRVAKMYDLSRLKSPDICFPFDPADGIESVELRELRLNLGRDQGWKRRISFAVDDKAFDRVDVHEMILQTIDTDGIRLADVVVASARIRIRFAGVDNQRGKRLTFTITPPDRCSLRDNYHDHIARKYLRRWGLTTDSTAAKVSA